MPGASVALIAVWNLVFVIFTYLQLTYNRTPLHVDGLPLLSISDAVELLVPIIVVPLYWAVWISAFRAGATPRFWWHLMPMLIATALFTHGHGIHLSSNSLSNLHKQLSAAGGGSASASHDVFVKALDL